MSLRNWSTSALSLTVRERSAIRAPPHRQGRHRLRGSRTIPTWPAGLGLPRPQFDIRRPLIDHPTFTLRAGFTLTVGRPLQRRAALAVRLPGHIPALRIGIPRLVLRVAAARAAHVIGDHAGYGQHPVGERPRGLSATQDHARRDAPLPRRPDRDRDVVPSGVEEGACDKGAGTAGAWLVTSRNTRARSSNAESPSRSRISRSFDAGNPPSGSGTTRPSGVSTRTIASAITCSDIVSASETPCLRSRSR